RRPPCQGFSLIGHRVIDDPINVLVKDFVRIVVELSPRFFLFENVKGLTVGKHRQILIELGNSSLLGLDMTSAAAYWGIDVPIAKRDRKNGARKRRQEEIEVALTT
ncbi:MAG: DNA cytosine methyltransferase, partial [bacterium]|nr:DNA cytosine methyltransferase [bacterium]